MIILLLIIAVAATVGTYIFIKNNPSKVSKIKDVVDTLKK